MKKSMISIVLLTLLAVMCVSAQGESRLGKPLADFTVQTIDGGTFTLSEALREKDMVLINLWASWCGPCEMEFPYLEEVYERHSDRAAVIALSIERSDTPERLAEYAEAHGLTFSLGSDSGIGLGDYFGAYTIPTTVVVDRFGYVALVETGAQTSAAAFEGLFRYFLDDGYTETTVLNGFPDPVPTVDGATEDTLDAAANADGGDIAYRNAEDYRVWPMVPTDVDGRTALVSTNAGVAGSDCAVCATITAQAGGALAFDFKTSAQVAFDGLYVSVDGAVVKRFTGTHDWTTWAIPLEAGEHEIALGYKKSAYDEAAGADHGWIDDVRVVSGDAAAALLAAMPVYPVSDDFTITVDGAAPVELDDPTGVIGNSFRNPGAWICGDAADIRITLTADIDPESAFVSTEKGGWTRLTDLLDADGMGYGMSVPVGDTFTLVYAYPDIDDDALDNPVTPKSVLLFNGEAGADAFVEYVKGYGYDAGWRYAGE